MIATRTILLFSLIQLAGCSNLGADSGGISSGGDHPSPAPSPTTTAQSASTDSASGPADPINTSTPTASTAPAATTVTAGTAAGSSGISITAAILANSSAGTMSTTGSLSGGLATSLGSGTSAGVESYLLCQAQIATGQICQISNYGVSLNGAAPIATLFTSNLSSTASVLASVTINSMSSSASISNNSAAWCAVQTSSGTYYQVTGMSSGSALPWVTDLISFLQVNCLSSGH